MSEVIEGGCHCGAVRIKATGAPQFQFLCHCDACAKLNGGLRLAGITFAEDDLQVTGPVKTYSYAGGKARIEASFCGTCGTPIAAAPAAYPGARVLRANCLDDHTRFTPVKSIFTDHACAWETLIA